uniref:Sugar phosphate transporter domain-containing protein n=1 Tax=Erythrolobus australicus TaxID=1077150 RepID=A0A7S1TKR7_9RHOD
MAAAGESAGADASSGAAGKALLAVYIGCWYAANILFNIFNKRLLKIVPLYTTVTLFQLAMGGLVGCALWATRLHKYQKVTADELKAIYPLALAHLAGNLFTNLSLRQMAVSFTHTIKASEPFFSVVIGKVFVPGTAFHPAVYASLVPIVAGVTLASVSEVSFNWVGFLTAMASNVSFQSRNVLSKKFMGDVKLDNLNLFAWISILSCATLAPFALVLDAAKYGGVAAAAADKGIALMPLLSKLCVCGFLHFLYNQFSYVVLQRVNPVTHAVGNTMKRVAVIASSILVFRNPVTKLNLLGTAIAIAGVAIYSQVKKLKPSKSVSA